MNNRRGKGGVDFVVNGWVVGRGWEWVELGLNGWCGKGGVDFVVNGWWGEG